MDTKLQVQCWAVALRLLLFMAQWLVSLSYKVMEADRHGTMTAQFNAIERLADKALQGLSRVQ